MNLRALFHKNRAEQEMDEEFRFHLEKQIEQNIARGMSPDEARYAALRQFGNVSRMKEECRERWSIRIIEELLQDLRYGFRQLRHNPGFTATIIITLALGIGANTAIFSLVNALLFKNLPVRNPSQLVILTWAARKEPKSVMLTGASNPTEPRSGRKLSNVFSYSIFKAIQKRTRRLTDVFAFAPLLELNVAGQGKGRSVPAVTVSGNYFSALGIHAAVGRLLQESDDQANAPCSAVISYKFWQKTFGGNPSVPGKTVALNGTPCSIIGVTPEDFRGLQYLGFNSNPDVTVPLMQGKQLGRWELGGRLPLLTADNRWGLQIMARLRPGVSRQQAQLETNGIFQQGLNPAWTKMAKQSGLPQIVLLPGSKGPNFIAQFIAKPATILLAVVTLLLIVACANVASLFLARGAARRREFTVRLAMGAGRGRLVRQLVTESLLLVSAGGAAGLLLAWWAGRYLLAFMPSFYMSNLGLNVNPDLRVLGFAAVISIFTGILFGLGPAIHATRIDLSSDLKEGMPLSPRASASSRLWSRKGLVTFQLSISFLLVVVAGLLVRTLQNLNSANLGFNPHNVLVFRLTPTANGYHGKELVQFYNRLLNRLDILPGVDSASASSDVLISDMGSNNFIEIEGAPPSSKYMGTNIEYIAPRYFKTMDIPLLAGRGPQPGDTAGSLKVAVINEAFARRYFPGAWPLGKRFRWKDSKNWIQIVGLVGNAKFYNVRAEPPPIAYIPFLQCPWLSNLSFEVRAGTGTAAIAKEVYLAVHGLDPNLPVVNMKTQEEQIEGSLNTERLLARLAGLFGALGLALTCVGLYGIMAYNVSRRTGEIGIRMALGADRQGILWLIFKQSLPLVLAGLAIGCLLALAATRLVASLLYGITPTDPVTLAASMVLLFFVAVVACYIPARRAARVDPMVALRYE